MNTPTPQTTLDWVIGEIVRKNTPALIEKHVAAGTIPEGIVEARFTKLRQRWGINSDNCKETPVTRAELFREGKIRPWPNV